MNRDEMLGAFLARDASYDGLFFTGVRTTGIFCKPSCPAKKPRPENVDFFRNVREAMFAGFRACKRCKPVVANGRDPEWASRLLAMVDADPKKRITDGDLLAMDIHPARARRWFLDRFGMTFHAYQRAQRLGDAFTRIRDGAEIDDVVFDSGYESHSGFREAFSKKFGKAPGAARQDDCVVLAWLETPVGPMIAGATSKGVCLLEFTDRRMLERQMSIIEQRFGSAVPGDNEHLAHLRRELDAYFARDLQTFTVPLDIRGTPFQESVWRLLLQIPYAGTWSYEELATRAGNPAAVRAVARANGMNRMAIIIPCHRVVNKSGELGGYGGGLWRKKMLLDLERGTPGLF